MNATFGRLHRDLGRVTALTLYVGLGFLALAMGSALAGLPEGAALPAEGTREELDLAGRMSDALAAMLGPTVEGLYPWTIDRPEHPRRFRRRLTWLLLRPGRLDRDG